jgi:mxaC protein
LAFDHPVLPLLLLACVPILLGRGARWLEQPSLVVVPRDAASRAADGLLRVLAAIPVAAIVLALAGLHTGSRTIERIGTGAHIVVVIDRSLSMDEPFALIGEKAAETKTAASVRMIEALFARRPHDMFGVVAFSTSPIVAMPLTDHREAIAAALYAMRRPGLANTEIGAGIAMGLAQFAGDKPDAARVILLVTDGAGVIPDRTRAVIAEGLRREDAHLYYLYLRAGDDPPLAEASDGGVNLGRPSGLDAYFRTLGVTYASFEARDPSAIDSAARRIEALETRPIIYTEAVPRRDLQFPCLVAAAIALLLGLAAQLAERASDTRARRA